MSNRLSISRSVFDFFFVIVEEPLQAADLVSFEFLGKRKTGRVVDIHSETATVDCQGQKVRVKLSRLFPQNLDEERAELGHVPRYLALN